MDRLLKISLHEVFNVCGICEFQYIPMTMKTELACPNCGESKDDKKYLDVNKTTLEIVSNKKFFDDLPI